MRKRFLLKLIAACAIAAGATAGFSQDVIKIANIGELSGAATRDVARALPVAVKK